MNIYDLYHFLFETYAGIGVLVGAGIVISLIVCVVLELRTRKRYHNHELPPEEDEWSIFADDDDDDAESEESEESDANTANIADAKS